METPIFYPECLMSTPNAKAFIHTLTKKNNYKGVKTLFVEYSLFKKNGDLHERLEGFVTNKEWVPVISKIWDEHTAMLANKETLSQYISESLF